MIPTQIRKNIVYVDTPAVYAYYIVKTNHLYPLACVCDENDVLVGVIGQKEVDPARQDITHKSCGEICNRKFSYLDDMDKAYIYKNAVNIFAEKGMAVLPIVDGNGVPVRLLGKFQAFFLDHYKFLPYYYYAHGLIDAARFAKSRGYNRISAIEFGVASGRGLIHLELYAQEISRLLGIDIDVYGFDSGNGLFSPVDYRDCPECWIEGEFKMDIEALQNRLYSAKLVIGDICKTTKTFMRDYNPAPIAFIAVDVDQYTPTVGILDMLLDDDQYFTPIITMYFDDVSDSLEYQGEALAVKEFNTRTQAMKIVPEHMALCPASWFSDADDWRRLHALNRIKWCRRFTHPRFASTRTTHGNIPFLV
jgi:hypothetical protein